MRSCHRQVNMKTKSVTVLALDKTMASTVTGPMDIFSLAGILWNKIRGEKPCVCFNVKIASVDGKVVTCLNQALIKPNCAISAVKNTDIILISAADLATMHLYETKVKAWLLHHYKRGSTVISVCTGAFVLAQTGLLDGKQATTHWGFVEAFRNRFPQVKLNPEKMITDEGRLLCGGGAHSYFDLCLYLVEKYCGYDIAVQCSKSLLLDMGRRSQKPYTLFEFQKQHGDDAVLKSQNWLEKNYAQAVSIDQMARESGMSTRNFKRRFKKAIGDTPLVYLQRFRVEAAKRLLEKSKVSIEEVSFQVGYENTAFFRTLFKKNLGITPHQYRNKFTVL